MAKNTGALHKCQIVCEGPRNLEGVIVSIEPGKIIHFRHRREGSSKWEEHYIPWSKLISYEGEQGKNGARISYIDNSVRVRRTVKGGLEFDSKLNMNIISGQEGEVIYVRPENLKSETIEGVDAPASSKKKSKEKEASKKKAA